MSTTTTTTTTTPCCEGSQWMLAGTFTYADFAAAAMTNSIPAYILPAKAIPMASYINLTQTFLGGSTHSCIVAYGSALLPHKYIGGMNVRTFPPSPIQPQLGVGIESLVSSTQLYLEMTTTGDNIDQLTQGSFDLYVYITTLP